MSPIIELWDIFKFFSMLVKKRSTSWPLVPTNVDVCDIALESNENSIDSDLFWGKTINTGKQYQALILTDIYVSCIGIEEPNGTVLEPKFESMKMIKKLSSALAETELGSRSILNYLVVRSEAAYLFCWMSFKIFSMYFSASNFRAHSIRSYSIRKVFPLDLSSVGDFRFYSCIPFSV